MIIRLITKLWNKEPVNESGSYPVENMEAGGGATGNKVPKGKLKIVKHIEGNKEKVIPNVSFKLYKESGEQVGGEYKTNEKGIVEILNYHQVNIMYKRFQLQTILISILRKK